MEEGNEFKCYGFILCKYDSMDKETRRALQGRKVVGSLDCMMRGRTLSMKVKIKALQDSLIVLTVAYSVET